jgi:hypothetical protein
MDRYRWQMLLQQHLPSIPVACSCRELHHVTCASLLVPAPPPLLLLLLPLLLLLRLLLPLCHCCVRAAGSVYRTGVTGSPSRQVTQTPWPLASGPTTQ